jgi:hypothetical protein
MTSPPHDQACGQSIEAACHTAQPINAAHAAIQTNVEIGVASAKQTASSAWPP